MDTDNVEPLSPELKAKRLLMVKQAYAKWFKKQLQERLEETKVLEDGILFDEIVNE